jgi:elongation factor P
MPKYNTSEFKNGLKIIINDQPCAILDHEFVKPGKGQAFTRVKFRNLKTGQVLDKTFKSGESVEAADVTETKMEYLYNDGNEWYFMSPETFEQYAIDQALLTETKQWVKAQDECTVILWNNEPILVEPPIFVFLKVTETEPNIKGDTVSGGSKAATLETGVTIRVPLFIEEGELIKVDTRDKSYVSRAKEQE